MLRDRKAVRRPLAGGPIPTRRRATTLDAQRAGKVFMRRTSTLSGWWVFAGVLLLIAGALNTIYGVAAIGNSTFFTSSAVFIFRDLRMWGWLSLILGLCEWVAAFSLWSGGEFGRWFGIVVASLNAVGVLLTISTYPFWSLAIFALSILIIYKLAEGPEVIVT